MNHTLREINLEGTFNFRDLGGYLTEDGRRVKAGVLFRSGNLSAMTEDDLKKVAGLGIKKICDLRGVDEIEKFPDPVLDGASWYHTPILSDQQILGQVGEHQDFADVLRATKPGELLLNLNKNVVTFKQALQNVLNVLLTEPHEPLLFHCMAGKDRTGAVAALFLRMLGVPRETILEDYLYTNETLDKMNAHFTAIGYNNLPNIEQEVLDALFEARAEYIEAFLDEIESNYDSIDVYLTEVLELTKADLEKIREHLLE
ncbi:tyrosine-protein phosphatase [Aquibacillus koreensis]|uniref:Tyrosine-protein phosphatase n=1 Tax=Aquibacillus koreensis TaxID=279446 RepID=A0A9X3WKU8_9BACI|nr:tyrosine-protein phosphatase [Aquibacillus koreensis]MCT2536012.1 tyrosine-protein phosphatase [Aquibacillus koreensis]MDC3420468.1 tyrosine-protein phosphatase [Aquibacillus koreensis]